MIPSSNKYRLAGYFVEWHSGVQWHRVCMHHAQLVELRRVSVKVCAPRIVSGVLVPIRRGAAAAH